MDTTLKLILRQRHNCNVAGGILLSAFTNIVTQANNYPWAINPRKFAGIGGLALFLLAGWWMLRLAVRLTRWYEVHGPLESDVLKAIQQMQQKAKVVRTFVTALVSFVLAVVLWLLFVTYEIPLGAS